MNRYVVIVVKDWQAWAFIAAWTVNAVLKTVELVLRRRLEQFKKQRKALLRGIRDRAL